MAWRCPTYGPWFKAREHMMIIGLSADKKLCHSSEFNKMISPALPADEPLYKTGEYMMIIGTPANKKICHSSEFNKSNPALHAAVLRCQAGEHMMIIGLPADKKLCNPLRWRGFGRYLDVPKSRFYIPHIFPISAFCECPLERIC